MKVSRWRLLPKGVTPLELWDLPSGSELFYQRVGATRVADLRRRGLAESEIGRCLARDLLEVAAELHRGKGKGAPPRAAGFEVLYLTGGLSEVEGFRPAAKRAVEPFLVTFGREGRFGGEAGGELLLAEQGHRGGLIVDVGQSAIKCSIVSRVDGGRTLRRTYERDPRRLPQPTGEAAPGDPVGQAALAWVAESVSEALSQGPPTPAALVLALPCALDEAARPGSSTYPGWEGDDTLVDRLLQLIGEQVLRQPSLTIHPWRHAETMEALVLNDAELAALSARAEIEVDADAGRASPESPASPASPARKTLVLTLGFGPGAALLEPAGR